MDCHFRDLPDFQSSEARLMLNQWQIPKMTVHKKLLIKFSTKFADLGVIHIGFPGQIRNSFSYHSI